MSLVEIQNLSLSIGEAPILRDVDLSIAKGEVLGLVGESGSGKSMTALTLMGLLPPGAKTTGSVRFDGVDILGAPEAAMNRLRGDDIGMVFQEPMTALNPVHTIGRQVAEGIAWHKRTGRADAEDAARKMLDRVGLPEAKFPLSRYPHELSGGQRQRVVIAIACALNPKLLIADEPTTALDVVLQKQILELLKDLVDERGMGLLLISHDLAVVTDMADRVAVMRHGEVLETGETARVLSEQRHPYVRQLAQASVHVPERRPVHDRELPPSPSTFGRHLSPSRGERIGVKLDEGISSPASGGSGAERSEAERGSPETKFPLLCVSNVSRVYGSHSVFSRTPPFIAVESVSFAIDPGESVALVGRSGCGKSTLARMILALDAPTSGDIALGGVSLLGKSEAELRPLRRDMQVVFQDPYGSFNPRHTVERLVAEPLHLLETAPTPFEKRERVAAALREVGLVASDMQKYPHEFSGGQRQRLSIARALITRPALIVADEPVSALDVSIRAQVLDLFADLNQRLGVAYLFITHDLTVARAITDRVMVMHEGRMVEEGETDAVFDHPKSDAAKALVDAAPDLKRAIRRRLAEAG